MSLDEELTTFDPDTVEGLLTVLAAIKSIKPQFEKKSTWERANRRVALIGQAVGYPAPIGASARGFAEHEHPRGPDGRFIEKFGWVRWFDFDRMKWFRGKVMDIDEKTGTVTVNRRLDKDNVGVYEFKFEQAEKQLYQAPKAKGSLNFPDVTKDTDDGGWKHLGGQGGSNPGGTFELDDNDGHQLHEWTPEELELLLHGRPSVHIAGFIADKEQFDEDDYSDRLKDQLKETYQARDPNLDAPDDFGNEGEIKGTSLSETDEWERIPGGRRSLGGVIKWDDPDEGPQIAVVNRDDEQDQRPTPEGKWRADYALQNWVLRRVRAKLLPQNPERKLHPSWRRVIYGIGPDTGLTPPMIYPNGFSLPRLPNLGKMAEGIQVAEGVAHSATQALETASEIRNAATGALVTIDQIITADPAAKLYPFELDQDVLGGGDRLRALINAIIEPSIRPGDRFYIKDLGGNSTGPDRVANEIMASRLYELAGVAVPDVFQGSDPAKIGSRIIGGDLTQIDQHLDNPEVMARVRKGFTVDAWLANWDVAGLTFDNIVVDEDGIPYRIDAGGALAYRAMGSPKGDMFTPTVGELVTLSPDNPRQSSSKAPIVFAGLTHEEKVEGAMRVAGISPQQIRDLGLETGLDQNTVDMIVARRTAIIDELLDGNDPFSGAPEEVFLPEMVDEPVPTEADFADLTGKPKADLDLINLLDTKQPDTETFDNPALNTTTNAAEDVADGTGVTPKRALAPAVPLSPESAQSPLSPQDSLPGESPLPVESMQPTEFPPATAWDNAWIWSGESQQWITSDLSVGAPTEDVLRNRWLTSVTAVHDYVNQLETDGATSSVVQANQLASSGALENPKGIILMTDNFDKPFGRTDMFVPWGTDADGNKVLISRISGQTVTPAIDWATADVSARSLDLSNLPEEDFNAELDWIDELVSTAADAQVSYDSMKSLANIADAKALPWLRMQDVGDDPADFYILEGNRVVTTAGTADGGLQITDAITGESLFDVTGKDLVAQSGGSQDFYNTLHVPDADGEVVDLVLPDLTGQQVIRAKLMGKLLQQRTSIKDAAAVTAATPVEDLVKPDPEAKLPDVSVDVRGSKPVPWGERAGPKVGDDFDYQFVLNPGSYIDTSAPPEMDVGPETHPPLPNTVPVIQSVNFESATNDLVGQWVMHDEQDFRYTRQPVLVGETYTGPDGSMNIMVTHPDGTEDILTGPPLSRLYIVEPPKEGRNVPRLDTEIIMGHNGDIRIGKEIVGQWWHADKNLSHRHTYGYMVEPDYTAHGKAVIGFRRKARDVRRQVRSEVWFADNYEDIEPESHAKELPARTLEEQLKAQAPTLLLKTGKDWTPGQAVDKTPEQIEDGEVSLGPQGVIIGGVHPSQPNLVYYKDHNTGYITMEDAGELSAHGDAESNSEDIFSYDNYTFEADGDMWHVQADTGNEVVAYSVTNGTPKVFAVADIPAFDAPDQWAPISTYEGKYMAGSLSTQEAKDQWEAAGGSLMADGEIPLTGTQVVDGTGKAYRITRPAPNGYIYIHDGNQTGMLPAEQFRVDRAHHGGVLGGLGNIELGTEEGDTVDFAFGKGDVLYTGESQYYILTARGELHNFSLLDGFEYPVLNMKENGVTINHLLDTPAVHRVGVYMPDSDTSVYLNEIGSFQVGSSSLVGNPTDAKVGFAAKDGSSTVLGYASNGTIVEYAGETPKSLEKEAEKKGIDIPPPTGSTPATPPLKPKVIVTPEDIQQFDPPAQDPQLIVPDGIVPVITGAGLPEGVLDGKTFPMSENSRSMQDAIEKILTIISGGEWDGKSVLELQVDHDAIEDFYIQVMPVRDPDPLDPHNPAKGQQYVEFFFRPLEDHAAEMWNNLVAPPPHQDGGEWRVPNDSDFVAPIHLAVGDVIAVRRGPNGVLQGWKGDGEFGSASVLSSVRTVGSDRDGLPLREFDVMLPNGKVATITQDDAYDYFARVEWHVPTPGGENPMTPVPKEGKRWPTEITQSALDADWVLRQRDIGSQVQEKQTRWVPGEGTKVLNTDEVSSVRSRHTDQDGMGGVFTKELGDGTKIWMSLANPDLVEDEKDKEPNNFNRTVFIQVPVPSGEDAAKIDPAQVANSFSAGLEAVGIEPERQTLPTPEALSDWAINTIGQHFGFSEEFDRSFGSDSQTPTVGPHTPGRKWTQEELENWLSEQVAPKIGRPVTLADFEYVVDPNGRLMVAASESLGSDISLQTGYVSHQHEGASRYFDPHDLNKMTSSIFRTLGGGASGDMISTATRLAMGHFQGGQSPGSDMLEGTGDRLYFWTNGVGIPEGRQTGYDVFFLDETLQRLMGNGLSSGDNYGRRTGSIWGSTHSQLSWTRMPEQDRNEFTVKHGVDHQLIELITVPDQAYPDVIAGLKNRGMSEVNGRPIEDVVIPVNQLTSLTERKKKRRQLPNSGFYPAVGNVSQVLAQQPGATTGYDEVLGLPTVILPNQPPVTDVTDATQTVVPVIEDVANTPGPTVGAGV